MLSGEQKTISITIHKHTQRHTYVYPRPPPLISRRHLSAAAVNKNNNGEKSEINALSCIVECLAYGSGREQIEELTASAAAFEGESRRDRRRRCPASSFFFASHLRGRRRRRRRRDGRFAFVGPA